MCIEHDFVKVKDRDCMYCKKCGEIRTVLKFFNASSPPPNKGIETTGGYIHE